ncbi:MAG: tryptophan-rich sensory protein [Candidatus ainarchaeum sp.]|nr:tryptophan-rich sensory protein [Candidatus ainarchaeum sp.]
MKHANFREAFKLVACVLLCQLAGVLGSIFTLQSIPAWYASLNKPFFTPPGWVFGPVWVTLYAIMGVSLYLAWKENRKKGASRAYAFFGVQLALNALWSVAFFGLRSPLYGLATIILLLAVLALTIREFHRISRTAGLLLVPYLAWCCFAALLNLAVFLMN